MKALHGDFLGKNDNAMQVDGISERTTMKTTRRNATTRMHRNSTTSCRRRIPLVVVTTIMMIAMTVLTTTMSRNGVIAAAVAAVEEGQERQQQQQDHHDDSDVVHVQLSKEHTKNDRNNMRITLPTMTTTTPSNKDPNHRGNEKEDQTQQQQEQLRQGTTNTIKRTLRSSSSTSANVVITTTNSNDNQEQKENVQQPSQEQRMLQQEDSSYVQIMSLSGEGDEDTFMDMCIDEFQTQYPSQMMRDEYATTIFHWVEQSIITNERYKFSSVLLQSMSTSTTAEEKEHYPHYYDLPPAVTEAFERVSCPYYLSQLTPPYRSNGCLRRTNVDGPSFTKRDAPKDLYMPMEELESRNTKYFVLSKVCGTIYRYWYEIEQPCRYKWKRMGLITRRQFEDDDADCRFNKMKYLTPREQEEYGDKILPLTHENYPLDQYTYDHIRYATAVSPIIQTDPNVHGRNIPELIENVMGGMPLHPSKDKDSDYWMYFRHILEMQIYRRKHEDTYVRHVFPVPDLWHNFTCADSARAVHDEYPGYWQSNLISYMLANREIRIDPNIIPQRSVTDFVNTVICLAHLNTWSIDTISATSFATKWYVGRCRPEEVAWKIATGELNEGVPNDIVRKIKRMKLNSAEEFTAYPEGSPSHPSWPAMHSAASSLSMWLAVVCDLTDEQLHQVKLTDYAVAYSRSVAGVHFYDDNLAGLNLGQEVIAQVLPDYLADRYGADPEKVRQKVLQYRFDWFEYDKTLFHSIFS